MSEVKKVDGKVRLSEFERTDFVWMVKYKGFCGSHP